MVLLYSTFPHTFAGKDKAVFNFMLSYYYRNMAISAVQTL